MWEEWVIDGTLPQDQRGLFCFCPIDGEDIVFGMNVLSTEPPHDGKVVGVIHMGGQEAADAFYEANKAEIDALLREAATPIPV